MSKKDKKRKEIKFGGDDKSVWDGDKIQQAVRFIRQNYNIRKPIQDTSKVTISHTDDKKYAYPPTLNDLYIDLQIEGINIGEAMLHKIIESNNHIPPYNPIIEYFDGIRSQYKGESHIELLCKHIVARSWDDKPEGYYQERCVKLIRKWMVACVACWIGNKHNDVALGFIEPKGGLGKTHLSKYLVPQSLSHFYAQSSDNPNYDIEDAFTRHMFINFDDLVGLNRRTIETFKSVLSSDEISTKQRHEPFATNKKRIGCALFSANKNQETGGFMTQEYTPRRFGIIEITDIDRNYSKVVDVDQMWSEALMLYEGSKFVYKFERDTDYPEFEEYNRRFVRETLAMRFLELYISHPTEEGEGEYLGATEILDRLQNKIKGDYSGKISVRNIGEAMRAMGFEQQSKRLPGEANPLKKYYVMIKDI